jgi:MFS family permease
MGLTKKLFNRSLRILLLTNGMVLVAGAMLAPIYAVFVGRVGGDILDASYAYGVFAAAAGVTSIFVGRISDRVNKKAVVITGYLLMAIGFLAYTQVQTVAHLLLVQIIIGIGESIYSPAFDALYSKHLDSGKSASEWGAWESMNYFSITVGAIGGGLIVKYFSLDTMFLVMSLLAFTSVLYLLRLPRKAV